MGFFMAIIQTWKDFIRYSLEVFSPKKREDSAVAAMALRMFHEEVLGRKLTLPISLRLLSDQDFIDGLLDDAHQELEKQTGDLGKDNARRLESIESMLSTVTDVAMAIQIQNELLVKENVRLHEKLDKANEMLGLAKQRAIRYFKTSLAISVSGIALGIAMRYGAVDFAKDRVVDLFSNNQSIPTETGTTASPNSSPSKIGPYGHCLPAKESTIELLEVGQTMIFRTRNAPLSIRLGPNPPIVGKKPQAPVQQPH
jgi:hypothetical protein